MWRPYPALRSRRMAVAIVAVLAALSADPARANPTEPAQAVVSLEVEPPGLLLHGGNRQQQLLVTGRTGAGRAVDVTHRCVLSSTDPTVATLDGSVVRAAGDGSAEVRIRLGAISVAVPVRVGGAGTLPPVHFANDVVPLFSKYGCNGGGCHGKASGQNGFRLSVFGFDPVADFDALVKEGRGRRVFAAAPDASLLLLKATGRVAHGGGRRIAPGSPDHALLLAWVRQGTPVGSADAPRAVALRVSPAQRALDLGSGQQVLATAVFSDGSLRDVTAAASYTSNAGQVAEAAPGGRVLTGSVPGEAAVTVHYTGLVAVARFQVPRPDAPDPYPTLPANNSIDGLVWAKLRVMGVLPSALADDATFFRRLHVDAIGTLPAPEDVRAFLADADPKKRAKAIDTVLGRPEYAAYWGLKWADVLLVNRDKLGDRGAYELHRWLVAQLARNRPYDEWARELIAAGGSSHRTGPANFFRAAPTPEEAARAVSQAFLGVRLECAQCHHHPFEKWGQDDFYALAAFFDGMQRKKLAGDEDLVFHAGGGRTKVPGTDRTVPARPPGGPALPVGALGDPRPRLAEWVTAPVNPYFARLAANRLWKHYFGRGLVEPEDDLRSTNPATNEPLLDHLARTLVASRYDLKALHRLILNSRAYQLSGVPNPTNADDEQFASHRLVRRLPAEVLLDAISEVTGVPEAFPGRPRGTRAIELWDNRAPSYFLDVFGRSERLTACACGRTSEPTMAQVLHLMNAPEIEAKIADPAGRVAVLVVAKKTETEIVEELCLAALGRPPGEKDKRAARKLFDAAPPREAARDFLWALLNSNDFLFAH